MKKKLFFITAFTGLMLIADAGFTETKTPGEGVWKIVEYVRPGKNSAEKDTTITNPQPLQMSRRLNLGLSWRDRNEINLF